MKPWRESEAAESESDFWISYSDLATGVLLVFVLMLAAALSRASDREAEATLEKDKATELRQSAQDAREAAELLKEEAEQAKREAQDVKEVNERLRTEAQRLLDIHGQLAARLKQAVDKTNEALGQVVFIFENDEVYVSEQEVAWFQQGRWALSGEAKKQVRIFYLNLYDSLLRPAGRLRVPAFLTAITVEGHTDPLHDGVRWNWASYWTNLRLSQRRAHSIVEEVKAAYGAEAAGFDEARPWRLFHSLVRVAGVSWTRAYCSGPEGVRPLEPEDFFSPAEPPCATKPTREMNKRSRRVTFGFKLDDKKLLTSLRKQLSGQSARE